MSTKQILTLVATSLVLVNGSIAETNISLLTVHPYSYRETSPAVASVPVGETVTLCTLEMNTEGQWYKNAEPIAGATARVLTLVPLGFGDGGNY